ncbi:uncharacterized mitochondrial protein AtMg00810-like [Humulus lupulus]|uniref:uncharacterized mitochondrial protein AtMg00810-like n=1 Tax=Humulus lupulus TaxID=3486 RepID=UPI002B417986|nr:uncharacterized mitochondrial protein AtMg00810-like [Humulus lupulus]
MILTGNDINGMEELKRLITQEFKVKDLGQMRYFMGMEFARTKQGISISQRKYVIDLLKETGMFGCKLAATPVEPKGKYKKKEKEKPVDKGMILWYLKKTSRKGLLFRKNGERGIKAFTDANWAGSIEDRRSTSGYCTNVWGNLVTWRSKKQPVVARSSAEAELRALAQGDWSSGKTIGSARMIYDLYYFEDNISKNKIAQAFSSISSFSVHDQIMVWHYRLGHPSFSYLKH